MYQMCKKGIRHNLSNRLQEKKIKKKQKITIRFKTLVKKLHYSENRTGYLEVNTPTASNLPICLV